MAGPQPTGQPRRVDGVLYGRAGGGLFVQLRGVEPAMKEALRAVYGAVFDATEVVMKQYRRELFEQFPVYRFKRSPGVSGKTRETIKQSTIINFGSDKFTIRTKIGDRRDFSYVSKVPSIRALVRGFNNQLLIRVIDELNRRDLEG